MKKAKTHEATFEAFVLNPSSVSYNTKGELTQEISAAPIRPEPRYPAGKVIWRSAYARSRGQGSLHRHAFSLSLLRLETTIGQLPYNGSETRIGLTEMFSIFAQVITCESAIIHRN
jgi:hypothetical protein